MLYARFVNTDCGYDYDKKRVKEQGLIRGERYLVEHVSMGQSHTSIHLEDFNGSFNSVHFEFENEDGTEHDIFNDPEYNPYLQWM